MSIYEIAITIIINDFFFAMFWTICFSLIFRETSLMDPSNKKIACAKIKLVLVYVQNAT